MTVVVFYASDETKEFREDLPKLSHPSFALCWHETQRPIAINPLDTVSIFCSAAAPSFSHLKGPIIFVEESVVIDDELLTAISDQRGAIVLINSETNALNWLEESPFICCGLCLPSPAIELDTSSYQAFRSWLGQTARSLNESQGTKCHLPVIISDSPSVTKAAINKSPIKKTINSETLATPLVSVIVPSFDRPLLLERCLKSIQGQTLQNFEVLVVTNKNIALSDPRIRSIVIDEKVGVSKARNIGLAQAKGHFVAYLDDDDFFLKDHLEIVTKELKDSGQKLAFSICARQWEKDCSSSPLAFDLPFTKGTSWTELLCGNKIPTPAVVHIKDPAYRFDEELECMEDWDLWLRVSKNSDLRFAPKVTCVFSRRPEQSSISSSKKLLFHWYGYPIWAKHLDSNMAVDVKTYFKSLLNAHSNQILEQLNGRPQGEINELLPIHRAYVARAISQLHQTGFLQEDISKQLLSSLDTETTSPARKTFDASVVVPLFNGLELTKALWRSICETPGSCNLEYIFVDNGSSDGTREWLESLGDKIHKILNPQNRNFAGASNQGAVAANSEIVIFLNNDTEVTPNWEQSLIKILNTDGDVIAVGNKQVFPGTSRLHHAGIYIDLSGHPKHYLEGVLENDPRVNFTRECVAVTGACLAIRKKDFLAAGGFLEDYKNGYEDIDLCLALGALGKKIIYCPESLIYHHVSKSLGRSTHNSSNWTLFMNRCSAKLMPDLSKFLKQNFDHNC